MRLTLPTLGPEELDAVAQVLDSGYLTQGAQCRAFEDLVAARVGVRYASATSSATTGLHLALHALGVGVGDEVIVPDFSFPATANAVVQAGATPIFVDIDPVTFALDPAALESAVTDRTRVVMPVHPFGTCADMPAICTIAARHDLRVVEDAACALGSVLDGQSAGSFGDAGVFSFHPRKVITTGEGGMLVTEDADLARRLAVLRAHGGVRDGNYLEFVDAGFNYRLSDIQAAIGVVQMSRLDWILARRRHLASVYDAALSDVEWMSVGRARAHAGSSFQSYVVMLHDGVDREAVIQRLGAAGVESTLGTYGLHLQPYYRERFGVPDERLPVSTRAHRQALTLPLHPAMTSDDIEAVVSVLADSYVPA